MIDNAQVSALPSPMMPDDKKHLLALEQAIPPSTENDKHELQVEMNFNYRYIGELIYDMVTCHLGFSYPLIKLSQYSSNPPKLHYEPVIDIF